MNKPKDRLLPLKLSLELVAVELELSDLSLTEQYAVLHQYQKDFDLTIRLGGYHKFPGQLVSDGLEVVMDHDGEPVFLTQGATSWFDSSIDEIALGSFVFLGDSRISISSVIVRGHAYYVIDELQMHPESIGCDLQDVYIDKEDFVDFRDGEHRTVPVWADPSSDLWAPELSLAVKLHKALRVDGGYSNERTMEDKVRCWIQDHMPGEDVGGSQITRIASVIGDARQQPWPKKHK